MENKNIGSGIQDTSIEVSVLGTIYTIKIGSEYDYPALKKMDGYTDTSTKEIIVDNFQNVEDCVDAKGNLENYAKSVIRHEIIHAFLYESGLAENTSGTECWATNEEMVDWFAIQFPKLSLAFEQAGCTGFM